LGVCSASVDVSWRELVAAICDEHDPATIAVDAVRRYDLGDLGGLPLAITDAVALGDGRICVSATAEDAPDAIADGPVAGSVLGLLADGADEGEVLPLPDEVAGCQVEGLALLDRPGRPFGLLAVVVGDDPAVASLAIELALTERPR
jgi:hypothetical protein